MTFLAKEVEFMRNYFRNEKRYLEINSSLTIAGTKNNIELSYFVIPSNQGPEKYEKFACKIESETGEIVLAISSAYTQEERRTIALKELLEIAKTKHEPEKIRALEKELKILPNIDGVRNCRSLFNYCMITYD